MSKGVKSSLNLPETRRGPDRPFWVLALVFQPASRGRATMQDPSQPACRQGFRLRIRGESGKKPNPPGAPERRRFVWPSVGSSNGHESTNGKNPIGHLWAVSGGRQQTGRGQGGPVPGITMGERAGHRILTVLLRVPWSRRSRQRQSCLRHLGKPEPSVPAYRQSPLGEESGPAFSPADSSGGARHRHERWWRNALVSSPQPTAFRPASPRTRQQRRGAGAASSGPSS